MKKTLTLTLSLMFLSQAGLVGVIDAQGYVAGAQVSSQAVGDGTYNYTITLTNESASTQSIGTFWFAWTTVGVDYYGYTYEYDYDLLTSYPTVTQMPNGWYAYISGYSGYGYSIEFYNYSGATLVPGSSYAFGFNSADSPDTLGQTSQYYPVPTMTSFVYNSYPPSDSGAQFVVTPGVTPPPPPVAPALSGSAVAGNGSFQLSFTNMPGYTFTILGTTNLSLAVTNWTVLGQVTDTPPGSGSYKFVDSGAATNKTHRYYRVSWP
jgi:hypothetical protein